jgi:hypothetical protein
MIKILLICIASIIGIYLLCALQTYLSSCWDNKYGKYKIFEHYDENNPSIKWYSAEVVSMMLFGIIPVYSEYGSICANKDRTDLFNWNSKESLIINLHRDYEFQKRKKEKSNRKIITKRIKL